MYLLQNLKTGHYFCEFAEHVSLDTKNIEEAADFHTPTDAERLKQHLNGKYEVVEKESVNNEN